MTDFRNNSFNPVIIAILWLGMYWPCLSFCATESFEHIQTIEWGPQPVTMTFKTEAPSQAIVIHTSADHPLSAYSEWQQEPNGVLRLLIHHKTITSSPIPIDILLPKQWSGTWRLIGGKHTLKGHNIDLKHLSIQSTGKLESELSSGQIETLNLNTTGTLFWKSEALNIQYLSSKNTGEGSLALSAERQLTIELIGNFVCRYTTPSQAIRSIHQVGQSKIEALPKPAK
jgi:hypothetical protein